MKYILSFSVCSFVLLIGCKGTVEVNCSDEPNRRSCVEACVDDPTLSHCSTPDDAGVDVHGDAEHSNCTTECEGQRPFCDEDNAVCVQCRSLADCEGLEDRAMCFEGACVECSDSLQCDSPDAPRCGEDGTCGACSIDDDCVGVTDDDGNSLGVCDTSGADGVCVGCTEETAEADCGDLSCNPATQLCTNTVRGDVPNCGACVSDAECPSDDFACVPMAFRGEEREGGYCLKRVSTTCDETSGIRSPTPERTSLSGAEPARYCGVNEMLTTCEALSDLDADKSCADANDCGAVDGDGGSDSGDGVCATVNGSPNKCSIPCTGANQCPGTYACPDTNTYCGDLT